MRWFRLYERIKKRKFKRRKRKQRGRLFGFEYLMNKHTGRKQNPNNSLFKALGG